MADEEIYSPEEYLAKYESAVEDQSDVAGLGISKGAATIIRFYLRDHPGESPLRTAVNVLSTFAATVGADNEQTFSRAQFANLLILTAGYLEREIADPGHLERELEKDLGR